VVAHTALNDQGPTKNIAPKRIYTTGPLRVNTIAYQIQRVRKADNINLHRTWSLR
jgi:hypothetical protein